jgi:hypothetical protein
MLEIVRGHRWLIAIALGACEMRPAPASDLITSDPVATNTAGGTTDAQGNGENGQTATVTASAAQATIDPNLPTLIATGFPTPVFSEMAWPAKDPTKASDDRQGVIRLGYLRRGATAPIKGEPVVKTSCPEGWYELVQGGFVCGKYATRDPNDKSLKNAPHAPFTEGPLPYEYGLNLTNGTPLYRRAPLRSERKEWEHGLQVGRKKKKKVDADGNPVESANDDSTAAANAGGGECERRRQRGTVVPARSSRTAPGRDAR